jgi:parvulin-like peptidyl-prolyl isomerase
LEDVEIMGMMAKMRSLAPWFIVTVGGLFVLFMVLSDSKISQAIGRRSNDIGEVNGEKITYQEFANTLDRYKEYQVQQTGKDIPENQMDQFREQVWQSVISQKLIEQKIKEFGLTVSDEEIKDVLLGPNPPQFVTQYFIDSTGRFNREAYDAALRDPQNKNAVLQLEDQVRQQLLQEKLASLVNAAAFVTDDEVKRKFNEDNIRMNADYILVSMPLLQDTTIKPTEAEIEKYYEKNKENYKQEETRKIKYVFFRTSPSHGDTVAVRKNLEAILKKVKTDTSGFKTYVDIYSDEPYSKDTLQITAIPAEAQSLLASAKNSSFIGPVLTAEGYILYKLEKKIKSKEKFVKASHILIKNKAKADSVYRALKAGADFAQTAKEVSEDPGSGKVGGDLGWFGKGQMVKPFEKAAFNGKVGRILKPVKSQFGWHIILVKDKTNKKFVVEKIVNKITASPTTIDRVNENASDFQYLADKNGFEKSAKELDYQVLESPELRKSSAAIPGLGSNRSLILFVFDNDLGDITPVFKFPSGYVVAIISDIKEEGYKPIDEIKGMIELAVRKEARSNKELEIAKEIRAKLGENGDFNIAKEIYPKAQVSSAINFTIGSAISSVGRDYAFSQKAFELPLNKISDPFKGMRGSYIIKVTSKTPFDSTSFSLQKSAIRTSLLNRKKSALYSQWLEKIKEEADIVDNRYQFYR